MVDKKFIFIVGLHRSGTSFLHDIIRDQNGISGVIKNERLSRNEGQHLQTLIPKDPELGGSGGFAFNNKSHLTEKSKLIDKIDGMDLFNQWKSHWSDPNSDVFVEKSPPNILRTRFLQELFPNSYFILITRHPIINSFATRKFNGGMYNYGVHKLIDHWFRAHEIFNEDSKYLNRVFSLSYEELTNKPTKVIGDIENFIDVEFSKRKFNTFNGNLKYHSQINNSYSKYEQMLNKYGYSINDLNKYPNTTIKK